MSSDAIVTPPAPQSSIRRRPLPRWLSRLLGVDYVIAGSFFIALVAITFAGVLMRYFFNQPFVWLEEVQLAFFVGLVYLGGGAAFRAGSHVAIDFLVNKFAPAVRRVIEYGISAIVVFTLGFFLVQGIGLVINLGAMSRTTSILDIPSALIYSAIPVGMALMIVNFIVTVFFATEEEAGLDA